MMTTTQTLRPETVLSPRAIERLVVGRATTDGAGVKLTRVLTQPLQRRRGQPDQVHLLAAQYPLLGIHPAHRGDPHRRQAGGLGLHGQRRQHLAGGHRGQAGKRGTGLGHGGTPSGPAVRGRL